MVSSVDQKVAISVDASDKIMLENMWCGPKSYPTDEWEGQITGNDGDNRDLRLLNGLQALSLRTVRGFQTTAQRIGSAVTQTGKERNYLQSLPGTVGKMEIDNRADTTVFGANMIT